MNLLDAVAGVGSTKESEKILQKLRDRRERIAAQVMAGFAIDRNRFDIVCSTAAAVAVEWADALIDRLDRDG